MFDFSNYNSDEEIAPKKSQKRTNHLYFIFKN